MIEEIKMICVFITTVAAAGAVVYKFWLKIDAVIDGIRCQLRTEMLRTYYRHKDDKRIRQYEMENFEHNFKAYTALGGNSFIGNVHEEVCTWEVVT